MDVCDPGQDMKNIRKLVLVHTGKKIKLSRDEVCDIFRSAKLGKLPLPPLGITRDKRYLMDAKSQMTQSDYEVLFSSSSVSTEIKRLARKVGLINTDKSISELKTAIGRRLRGMKVREPVMLTGGARTIKPISSTYNNVKNNGENTTNRNVNGNAKNINVNGNAKNININGNAKNINVNGNTKNRNVNGNAKNINVNGNMKNRNVSVDTPSITTIKTEPSVNIPNNTNRYRKEASNALVRRRRESALKLIQGATTTNVSKNVTPKPSIFKWLFNGSKNKNKVTLSGGDKNSNDKFKQLQSNLEKKQRELEQQQGNQAKKIINAEKAANIAKAAAVSNATNESKRVAEEAQKKLEDAQTLAKEIANKMTTVKSNAEANKAAALKQVEENKNAALKRAEENKNVALKEANAVKNKAIEEVKLAEKEAAQAATAEERAEAAEKLNKAQKSVTQAELNKTTALEKANSNMQNAKNLANKKIELSRLAANAGVNISNKINAINANTNINALRVEIQNKKSAANTNLKNKRQTQLSNLVNSSNALNNQDKVKYLNSFEKGTNFNTLMNTVRSNIKNKSNTNLKIKRQTQLSNLVNSSNALNNQDKVKYLNNFEKGANFNAIMNNIRKNIKNKSNTNLKNKQQSHLSNLLNSSNALNNQMKVKYLNSFEKGANFNAIMNNIRKNIKSNSNAKLVNAQQKAAKANILRASLNAAKVNLEAEKAASQTKINEAIEAAKVAERAAANANSANEREKAAKNLQNAQNKLSNVQSRANQAESNLKQAANNAQSKRVIMMEKLINNSSHLTNTNKIAYTRRFSEGEKIKDLAEEIRAKMAANQQKALNNAKAAANVNKQKALNNAKIAANAKKAANNAEAARKAQEEANAKKAANNAEAARKAQEEANAKKAANNAEAAREAQEEANAKKAANNAEAARKAKKNKNSNELSVLLNSSNVLNNKAKVKYLNSFEKGANFNTLMNTVKADIKAKTNKRNANTEAANEAGATAAMEKLNKNAKLQGNKNRKMLLKLFETTKTNKKEANEYINAFEKGRRTLKEIKEDIVMKAKRNAFGRKLESTPNAVVNNNAEMKATAVFNNLNVGPKRNALMGRAKKEVAQIGGRIGKWGNAIKGVKTLNNVANLEKKLNKKSELRNEIKISKLGPINKTGHRVKIMQLENNVGARRRIFEQQLTNIAQKAEKKELSTYISGLNIFKANKNVYIKQIGLPNANLNMIRASANRQVSNKSYNNAKAMGGTMRTNPLSENNNGEISAAALAPVKNKVPLRLGGRAAEPRPPDAPAPTTPAPRSFKGVVKNMREKKVMNGVRVAAKIAKNQKEISEATGAQRIKLAREQRAATNRNKGVNTTTAASLLTTSSSPKSRQQRRMNEAVAKKVSKQANTKKRLNNQATRAKALKVLKARKKR